MADSFYVPLSDDMWRATTHTTGPWDSGTQHGGPPSALLGRAMQLCDPRPDMIITRFTCEFLRAIPVGDISIHARVASPGRSGELLVATASTAGREVARASAWRVRRTGSPSAEPQLLSLPGKPDESPPVVLPAGLAAGYISAIECRQVRGRLDAPGPATLWARMRYPLVPGETPTPLERVLLIADSGSGASMELDMTRWTFVNPEITVHLYREADGEWICLDAQTVISAGGTGIATSVLSDINGPVGVGAQSLLIAPRPARPA